MSSVCKKTFKDYYAIPEYKAKHNLFMCQKVQCKCGLEIARSYMSTHKKTKKHNDLIILNEENNKQKNEINQKKVITTLYNKISDRLSKRNIKKLIKKLENDIK